MDRRDFLRGFSTAAGVAIVSATAGCGGSESTPTSAPRATPDEAPADTPDAEGTTAMTDTPLATAVVAKAFDFETADDGHLVVIVPLENRASDRRTRTIVVTVTADGERHEQPTEVTLDAGESRTLEVDFQQVDLSETNSISAEISFEE